MLTLVPPGPQNPFAPPVTDDAPPPAPAGAPGFSELDDEIRQALEQLDLHVADAAALEAERRAERRFRPLTGVLALLSAAAIGLAFTKVVVAVVAAVVLPLFLLGVANSDLRLRPRAKARTPRQAMDALWRAARLGQAGYYWASLCPAARASRIAPPRRAPRTGPVTRFAMDQPQQVGAWLRRWAVSGFWRGRRMTVSYVKEQEQSERAALVRSVVEIMAWPWWSALVVLGLLGLQLGLGLVLQSAAVAATCWIPAVLVGLVLQLVTRRVEEFRVDKVLLRGRNGLWYQLRADLER